MAYLIIRHRVKDFLKWKPIYDAHGSVTKKAGCRNEQLFRSSENPKDLVLLFELNSIDNARDFSQSSELKKAMCAAGVVGTPEFEFLEELERKVTGEGLKKVA